MRDILGVTAGGMGTSSCRIPLITSLKSPSSRLTPSPGNVTPLSFPLKPRPTPVPTSPTPRRCLQGGAVACLNYFYRTAESEILRTIHVVTQAPTQIAIIARLKYNVTLLLILLAALYGVYLKNFGTLRMSFLSTKFGLAHVDDPPTSAPSPAPPSPGVTDGEEEAIVVPETFNDGQPLPRVLVFDLDYTLWPFWCDTHIDPPVRPHPAVSPSTHFSQSSPTSNGDDRGTTEANGATEAQVGKEVQDASGEAFSFFSDVPSVLAAAARKGMILAVASRTYTPDLAAELLSHLHVPVLGHSSQSDGESNGAHNASPKTQPSIRLFSSLQMYPGSKISHMKAISSDTGLGYEEMLFFDDEERNRDVEKVLGVQMWLLRDGVTVHDVDQGIKRWRRRHGKGEGATKKRTWPRVW